MVWGMLEPSSFGKFWPDGVTEDVNDTGRDGWYDRLKAHYVEQTPQERRRLFDFTSANGNDALHYSTFPSRKFRTELGTVPCGEVHSVHPPSTPIEPHEPPRSYSTRPHKALGSLIALCGAPMAVDEDLKTIIERLEPGVHEFFPIKFFVGPNEQPYHKAFFTMRIGQYFSSFLPDESAEGSYIGPSPVDPTYYGFDPKRKSVEGLAFSKITFGRAHLWRERNFPTGLTLLSDELISEIDNEGLLIPKHHRMREV